MTKSSWVCSLLISSEIMCAATPVFVFQLCLSGNGLFQVTICYNMIYIYIHDYIEKIIIDNILHQIFAAAMVEG